MGITAQQFKQMEDRVSGVGRTPSPRWNPGCAGRPTRTR